MINEERLKRLLQDLVEKTSGNDISTVKFRFQEIDRCFREF